MYPKKVVQRKNHFRQLAVKQAETKHENIIFTTTDPYWFLNRQSHCKIQTKGNSSKIIANLMKLWQKAEQPTLTPGLTKW
jgi:hypothetical protein